MTYKVTYDTKSKNNFLITQTKEFSTYKDAMNFIRSQQGRILGRAVLEEISSRS